MNALRRGAGTINIGNYQHEGKKIINPIVVGLHRVGASLSAIGEAIG
jgi:hypothetical protein